MQKLKGVAFILLIFTSVGKKSFAQDSLASYTVAVVPFESKMYNNSISDQLMTANEMDYEQIRTAFQKGLDHNLMLELQGHNRGLSFLESDSTGTPAELGKIYQNSKYEFKVFKIEDEREPEKKKGLQQLFKKKEQAEDQKYGARIENGEIVSQVDHREKHVSRSFTNPSTIENICKKYNVDRILFINQFEIGRIAAMKAGNYDYDQKSRIIKIHYTILKKNGKEVASGISETYFPSSEFDLQEIIYLHLMPAAREIVGKIR